MVVDVPVTRVDVVPFSGSSCYFAAAAAITAAVSVPETDVAAAMTAACGLSCFSSAAADAETTAASAANVILKGACAPADTFSAGAMLLFILPVTSPVLLSYD